MMVKDRPTGKPSDISKHDLYKKFFTDYIEKKNFIVKDKNTFNELKKIAWSDSKLVVKRGSQHDVTTALREVLKDRGIQIAGTEATTKSAEIGNMRINFEKIKDAVGLSETNLAETQQIKTVYVDSLGRPITQAPVSPPTLPSGQALPQQQTQQTTFVTDQQIIKLDPVKREEYQRIFSRGFSLVTDTYVQLGFVEGERDPEKPMTAKDFKEKVEEYSKDVANYCFEHNIHLPQWIELFALGVGGVVLLGSPLIQFALHGRKQKENTSTKLKENAEKASTYVFKEKKPAENITTTTTTNNEKKSETESSKNTIDSKNEKKSGLELEAISKNE